MLHLQNNQGGSLYAEINLAPYEDNKNGCKRAASGDAQLALTNKMASFNILKNNFTNKNIMFTPKIRGEVLFSKFGQRGGS